MKCKIDSHELGNNPYQSTNFELEIDRSINGNSMINQAKGNEDDRIPLCQVEEVNIQKNKDNNIKKDNKNP